MSVPISEMHSCLIALLFRFPFHVLQCGEMKNRFFFKDSSVTKEFQDFGLPLNLVVLIAGVFVTALILRTLAASLDGQWQTLLIYGTAGLFVIGSFALVLKRPDWTLPLAVALFPLQYALYLPVFRYRLTPSEVLVLVWLLVVALDVLRGRRKIRIPDTSINILLLAYVLALSFSLLGLRSQVLPTATRDVLLEWVAQVYLVVLFLLLVGYTDVREQGAGRIKLLVGAWGLGAFCAALAALVAVLHYPFGLFSFDSSLPLVSETHKVTGLFRNSNAFASYVLSSLLVFGGLLLYGRPTGRMKRLLIVLVVLLALAMILTQSQGAWGGLAAGLVLLSLPTLSGATKWMRWALVLSFAGLVAIGLFLLSGLPITSLPGVELAVSLISLSGYEIERLPQRLSVLNLHRSVWTTSPVFGVGIGGLKAYTAWLTEGDLARGAHNAMMGVAAETGLAGLVVVTLIGIATIRRSLFNLKWELGRWLPLAIGLAAAFIAQQVYGLSHDIRGEKHLWLVMALIIAVYLDYRSTNLFAPAPKSANMEHNPKS